MTSEVGFWFKGKVRRLPVLPIYEMMTFYVELIGYEVKVYNDNKECVVEFGTTIEDALFGARKLLEKRQDFFD